MARHAFVFVLAMCCISLIACLTPTVVRTYVVIAIGIAVTGVSTRRTLIYVFALFSKHAYLIDIATLANTFKRSRSVLADPVFITIVRTSRAFIDIHTTLATSTVSYGAFTLKRSNYIDALCVLMTAGRRSSTFIYINTLSATVVAGKAGITCALK